MGKSEEPGLAWSDWLLHLMRSCSRLILGGTIPITVVKL